MRKKVEVKKLLKVFETEMASQLATQGYRIAKSWQYQENLPDPGNLSGVPESAVDNNNSFFVSSSLNPVRATPIESQKKKKKIFGIFPTFCKEDSGCKDGDPSLQRPLLKAENKGQIDKSLG